MIVLNQNVFVMFICSTHLVSSLQGGPSWHCLVDRGLSGVCRGGGAPVHQAVTAGGDGAAGAGAAAGGALPVSLCRIYP